MTIRVRFAPSPTGYLHIGGARTALFNWLYARHTGGKFVLRIEDTDLERSTQQSVDAILDGLAWLGLDHDEEIVTQSARRDEHVALAWRLYEEGYAYKCYCTAEELEQMREEAIARGDQPRYDRRWRDNDNPPSPDAPFSLRFKMPLDGALTIDDMVLGSVTVENQELDDLIILRSDGTPTYNLVVVADDHFMGITHVVRGQDHFRNTYRQAHIYKALGFELPTFGHLPLVDGLSKRKGSASVQQYRDAGYLSEAVINYIARLGWSHGDQEIFSREELVEFFDVVDVNRGSASFDEQKMRWVNTEWIRRLKADDLAARLLPYLHAIGVQTEVDERLCTLVDLLRERSETMVDMAENARFAFIRPTSYDEKAVKKWMKAGSKQGFVDAIALFESLDTWTADSIDKAIHEALERNELKFVKLGQPIRVALTGTSSSPGIAETAAIVGQEEVVARMKAALSTFPDASE